MGLGIYYAYKTNTSADINVLIVRIDFFCGTGAVLNYIN